jgi:cytochrome c553
MTPRLSAALFALSLLALPACGDGETPDEDTGQQAATVTDESGGGIEGSGASGVPAVKAEAAAALYAQVCTVCHGEDGKGNGPAAAALDPKPASFVDAAWQDAISDKQILTVLKEGGKAVGKSEAMVAAPGAKDDPELAQALLHIVRSYRP